MKTADELVRSLANRIGRIYYHSRPLMYARTAEELDDILFLYHELWAEIVEREVDWSLHVGNSMGIAIPYAKEHPDATESQIAQEVVRVWSAISKNLGVPIPNETLVREVS